MGWVYDGNYHLTNLHISKAGISLEQKEMIENRLQHSSSNEDPGAVL